MYSPPHLSPSKLIYNYLATLSAYWTILDVFNWNLLVAMSVSQQKIKSQISKPCHNGAREIHEMFATLGSFVFGMTSFGSIYKHVYRDGFESRITLAWRL